MAAVCCGRAWREISLADPNSALNARVLSVAQGSALDRSDPQRNQIKMVDWFGAASGLWLSREAGEPLDLGGVWLATARLGYFEAMKLTGAPIL